MYSRNNHHQTGNSRRGFTLLDVLITLGIIGILALIVTYGIGPYKVLRDTRNAERFYHIQQLQNSLDQYTITSSNAPWRERMGTGTGSQATPICRHGETRDSSCLQLDALVGSGFIADIPSDKAEPCPTLSGYSAYFLRERPVILADQLGALNPGEAKQKRCIFDTVAPEINTLSSSLYANTSTISWLTDEIANSRVEYGATNQYGNLSTLQDAFAIDHGVTITGLASYTTYHYRVISRDAEGNVGRSSDATFMTEDATPPVLLVPPAITVAETSATVTWTTDEDAESQVICRAGEAGPPYPYRSILTTELVRNHSATVTDLLAGSLYYCAVLSQDANGNLYQSLSDFTLRTLPDTTPPTLSGILWNADGNAVTFTWNTGESASTQVAYGSTTSYGSVAPASPGDTAPRVTTHTVTVPGLTYDTQYHFQLRSSDAAGNVGNSPDIVITITDSTAPSLTGSPTVAGITTNGATISWTTTEASTTQLEYGPTASYGTVTSLDTAFTAAHTQQLTGLLFGTTYHFRIKTRDAAGNAGTSADQTFTTSSIIIAVTTSGITANSATVTWNTTIPADTQVLYGTSTGSMTNASPTTPADTSPRVLAHSRALTGLTIGTIYYFRVRSSDAYGTVATGNGSLRTLADVTAPALSAVTLTNRNTATPTVTWTTNEAASSQVEYGLTTGYGQTSGVFDTSPMKTAGHTFIFQALTMNVTYYYRLTSRDAAGNAGTVTGSFATDNVAPVLNLPPTVSGLTGNAATINWSVNESSYPQVIYSINATMAGATTLAFGTLGTNQSQTLTGLAINTTYYYQVNSKDVAGNIAAWSSTYSFSTSTDVTAPALSAVTLTNRNTATPTVTWTTNEAASSQVEYGLTTGYGQTSGVFDTSPMKTAGHTFIFQALTMNVTYYYRLTSRDAAGNAGTVTGSFATDNVFPSVTGGPTVSNRQSTQVTIGWSVNESSQSRVERSLNADMSSSTFTSYTSNTTAPSISVTGLTADRTYYYRLRSRDAALNEMISATTYTFSTDVTAPTLSSVIAGAITDTTTTITWTTSEAADTQVEYGLTASYGSTTTLADTTPRVTAHSAALTGLLPNVQYHYRVRSADATGNLALSNDITFTTADGGAPTISALTASSIDDTTAAIAWVTSRAADTRVEYGPTAAYGSMTSLDASLVTGHSQNLTGLAKGTLYHYRARSRDTSGNIALSGDQVLTTTNTTPPVISGIAVNGKTENTATISWQTNEPADTQIEYGTTTDYESRTTLDTALVTSHGKQLTGLSANTAYHYRVQSSNGVGIAAVSGDQTFTTSADSTPPLISDVTGTPATSTTATVTWQTDEPADTQIEYGTTTDYGNVTTLDGTFVTRHSQTLADLTPNVQYHYRVRSRDSFGNLRVSTDSTVTTIDTVAPVITVPPVVTAVTATTATITWRTDEASDSHVRFGLSTNYELGEQTNITLVTNHTFTVTGVGTPGADVTYHARVRSLDAAGNVVMSPDFTFTTNHTSP